MATQHIQQPLHNGIELLTFTNVQEIVTLILCEQYVVLLYLCLQCYTVQLNFDPVFTRTSSLQVVHIIERQVQYCVSIYIANHGAMVWKLIYCYK